jgi:secreted trypsin-like serine protease
LLFLDVCPFCGQRLEAKAVGLIKGGTKAVNHEYPWHATIYHYDSSSLKYKCGGSIIRDNKIITAAHCVVILNQKISVDKLVVRIEEGELLASSKHQYRVFQSIVHEGYNHETFQHDIAILFLESSIDISHTATIRAVCLPTKFVKLKGNVGQVVGFGSTERHANESNILLATDLPIVKQEDCRDRDPSYYNKHMFSTNFCAGKRDFGVCQVGQNGKEKIFLLKFKGDQ